MSQSRHDQSPLPADVDGQAYVTVRVIVAGNLRIPLNIVFDDCHDEPDSNAVEIPAFSFLLTHPTEGYLLFDLGIRQVAYRHAPPYSQTDSAYRTARAILRSYITGCTITSKPSVQRMSLSNYARAA